MLASASLCDPRRSRPSHVAIRRGEFRPAGQTTTRHDIISRAGQPSVVASQCTRYGDGEMPGIRGTRHAISPFRMASVCQIPDHHHSNWVQVAVISGRMRAEQDAGPARIIPAGGVLFRHPWRGSCRDSGSRNDRARDPAPVVALVCMQRELRVLFPHDFQAGLTLQWA